MSTSHGGRDLGTSRVHSVRTYDSFLGGKDHFDVDATAALAAAEAHPGRPSPPARTGRSRTGPLVC